MKEKIIPILFQEYLNPPINSYDFNDYELNSSPEVQRSLLEDLSEENAHEFFEGAASRIHESSHRDVFYHHNIRCNFLHIAIQLNDASCVERLLSEYNVSPLEPLVYTYSKEKTDNDADRESEKEEETIAISPNVLAKNNQDVLSLLSAAVQRRQHGKITATEAAKTVSALDSGYETDDDEAPKEVRYKKRLILGDGNLSYSRALMKKQQNKGCDEFSQALTVTEYYTEEQLQGKYTMPETENAYRNFQSNVEALRENGAEVIFGVDATNIHSMFSDRRFRRIHFNFPYYYDDKLSTSQKKDKTRELVGQFLASAAAIQQPGDRIHMALVTGFRDPVWYEDATYGVGEFCEEHGYAYIKKRDFIDSQKGSRYPGYGHVKTSDNTAVTTAENGREFIFEKKILGKEYGGSSQKKPTSRGVNRPVLKSRDTDNDSSSYVEHSDYEGKDISKLSFGKIPDSAVKAKGASIAASLTLGGTVSSHTKEEDSGDEKDLVISNASYQRK